MKFYILIFIYLSRPFWNSIMSKFNLHPLYVALLGACVAPSLFAETQPASDQTHQLSTIVVSAAGFEQDIKNAPASISVVTKEDIEKKNATSIADLLADVPGIDIRSGVGKTSGLNIKMRGLGNDYSLILIDGRRQTTSSDVTPNGFGETSTGFMPPLAAIERIEVIRGPMATRYGSEAMGGVINIITKKNHNEWSGNVTVSGNVMEHSAEADSWKSSFVLNGPIINDRLGLQLRGSYFDRQSSERIVPTATTSRDPRPTKADIYDFGAKLDFQLDDQNAFWVDGFTAKQKYDNSEQRLGAFLSRGQIAGYDDELEFNRQQLSLGHDGDYNFGQWHTYLSHNTTETKGRTIPYEAFKDLAGTPRKLENTDIVFDSHLITSIQNHKLTLGTEYKDSTIADDIAGIGKEFSQDTWSVYAEDEWQLRDNLYFTFGGRFEDHSGFGGQFSPRAYLVWNTTDALTLKGGVSTGYKAPSAKDLYNGINGYGGQGTTPSIGNPDLEPETSTNYEIGFNYQPNNKFDLTATAFFNQVEDKITSKTVTCSTVSPCVGLDPVIKEYSTSFNAAEAEIYGVETALKYNILPEWNIKAAYTFTDSEVTKGENKGYALEATAKHLFNLTSTWHINENLDLWLQHEYQSARPRYTSSQTGGALQIQQQTNNEFSGYNLFNLGTSYQLNSNIRVNAAVNNLLDKDFTENMSYVDANGITQEAYKYLSIGRSNEGTYLAGRNYWLSISYDF